MTTSRSRRGILPSALALSTLFVPLFPTTELAAQSAAIGRPVTHDDYDDWPSLRHTA
jgi:hypothetical protein